MPENADTPSPGLNRRTILKASAWSLPVVAVAAATPLAAASADGDLQIFSRPGGTTIGGDNPAGTQTFSLTFPPGFDLNSRGTTRIPAGSTLIVSFDRRLLNGATVTMDNTPANHFAPTTDGNTTTVTFVLPYGIPSNVTTVPVLVSFATINDGFWVPDAEPYVVTIIAPAGSTDPNAGNNTFTAAAVYSPIAPA